MYQEDKPRQHIKKQRPHFVEKDPCSQSYSFSSSMYIYETWTIKKVESWKIDVFKLWCWRRLLRAPWTARRSNQSTLKEINPDYSLEGLMLKLQYFGHLMWRTDSFEKTLMLGKIEGRGEGDDSRWDGWMASPIQWTWVWASSGRWWRSGKPGVLQSMGSQRVGHDLSDWTTRNIRPAKEPRGEKGKLSVPILPIHCLVCLGIPQGSCVLSEEMARTLPSSSSSSSGALDF